jgi:hypothetical protein
MVTPPVSRVIWSRTHRIIRSRFPPIDLFEDIADPADWDAIASAETKTNPRVAESIGNLDLVPPERRVAGGGASRVMAPFVHASTDRPSRFSDGSYGVYHAGDRYEVALFETIHHHARFMAATREQPGWTSDFQELVGAIDADLHDIRADAAYRDCLDPEDYTAAQSLGRTLRRDGSDGIVYPSVRYAEGACFAAFWPDVVTIPVPGRHLSYYWSGDAVRYVKNPETREVFDVIDGR